MSLCYSTIVKNFLNSVLYIISKANYKSKQSLKYFTTELKFLNVFRSAETIIAIFISSCYWRRCRRLQRKIFRRNKRLSSPSFWQSLRCRRIYIVNKVIQLRWKWSRHIFLGRGNKQTWSSGIYRTWRVGKVCNCELHKNDAVTCKYQRRIKKKLIRLVTMYANLVSIFHTLLGPTYSIGTSTKILP